MMVMLKAVNDVVRFYGDDCRQAVKRLLIDHLVVCDKKLWQERWMMVPLERRCTCAALFAVKVRVIIAKKEYFRKDKGAIEEVNAG